MKQNQELEQTPSLYKDKYNQWVNKYLAEDKAKCASKNPALFVCVDRSCDLKQPLICPTRQCSCMKGHRKCLTMNLDYCLEVFKKDKPHIQVISQKLQETIDNLIDKLSEIKESFLRQLSKGNANHLFENQTQKQDPQVNTLLKSEFITGSIVSKFFSVANQGQRERRQLMVLDQIVGNYKLLENKGISMFNQNLKTLFFDKKADEQYCWDKKLSYQSYLQIDKGSVGINFNTSSILLGIMSPALTSGMCMFKLVKGRFVRWRLKITEFSAYIYLGIIFRDNQRPDKKNFSSSNQITNCYLIDQSGTTYAYNSPEQDQKTGLGISFQKSDVIEIELDKIDWVLKFKNSRFSPTSSIAITEIPATKSQSYHICVGFSHRGAKYVEIISTIETPYMDYQIGVST